MIVLLRSGKPKPDMKRILINISVVLLLLCLAGCAGSPVRVVRDFIVKTADGDVSAVKEYCTGDLLKFVTNAESLINWGRLKPANLGDHIMNMSQADLKGQPYTELQSKSSDTAEVLVKLKAKSFIFKLQNIDGVWKISDIDMGLEGTIKNKLEKSQGVIGH